MKIKNFFFFFDSLIGSECKKKLKVDKKKKRVKCQNYFEFFF